MCGGRCDDFESESCFCWVFAATTNTMYSSLQTFRITCPMYSEYVFWCLEKKLDLPTLFHLYFLIFYFYSELILELKRFITLHGKNDLHLSKVVLLTFAIKMPFFVNVMILLTLVLYFVCCVFVFTVNIESLFSTFSKYNSKPFVT